MAFEHFNTYQLFVKHEELREKEQQWIQEALWQHQRSLVWIDKSRAERILAKINFTSNSGNRCQAQYFGTFSAHDNDSASSVIERRGVSGGDGAIRTERRLQRRYLVILSLLKHFVFVEHDWVALLLPQRNWNNFIDKFAVFGGLSSGLVDLNSIFILFLTSDFVFFRSQVTTNALTKYSGSDLDRTSKKKQKTYHVDLVVDIRQTVAE